MATDDEIRNLLEDLIDNLKRKGRGGPTGREIQQELVKRAQTIRQFDQLNDRLKKMAKSAGLADETLEDINDAYVETNKHLRRQHKLQEDLNNSLASLKKGVFSLGDASTKGGEEIATYTGMFKDIPIIGTGLNDFGKSLDFNIDIFRQLASVGADFGQSLIQLRIASRNAALPLLEFSDFISGNSQNLAALFGSVNQGTVVISQFARNIRREVLPELAGLGITTGDYLNFLEVFLEQQRIQGRRERLDQKFVTDGLRTYALELDRVTRLTGVQRDQLNASVKAQRDDAVFQAFLRDLEPQRAAELQTFIAGLENLNPAIGEAVKNIVATGFPFNEFENTLVGTNDGLLDMILNLRNGGNLEEFAQALSQSADSFIPRFGSQVLRAGGIIGDVGNGLLTFQRRFEDEARIRREQTEAQEAFTKQLGVTQEGFRQFKSSLEGINTAFLQSIGPGIASFLGLTTEKLDGVTKAIQEFTTRFPGAVATAFGAAMFGKYFFEYAEQVGITALGTYGGLRLAGFGAGGLFSQMVGGLGKIVTRLGGIALLLGSIGTIFNAREKIGQYETSEQAAIGGIIKTITTSIMAGIGALLLGASLPVTLTVGGIAAALTGYQSYLGYKDVKAEGRALGGDIMKGQPYLVGEKGPELIVPDHKGYVVSNDKLARGTTQTTAVATSATDSMNTQMAELKNVFEEISKNMKRSEGSLNTLVGLTTRVIQNTGRTATGIQKYSGIITT